MQRFSAFFGSLCRGTYILIADKEHVIFVLKRAELYWGLFEAEVISIKFC